MSMYVVCGSCNSTLRLKDDYSGNRAQCPHCKREIDLASLSAETGTARLGSLKKRLKTQARDMGLKFADDADLKELSRLIDEAEQARGRKQLDEAEEFPDSDE